LRIVAATNRDLEAECKAKRFREDLFFRLSAATVRLPPLRQRPREIPVLARRFLADARRELGREDAAISDAVMQRLSAYALPGNVRELKNAMEYAAATMTGKRVELHDLPERLQREEEPALEQLPEEPPAPVAAARGGFLPLFEELRRVE